MEAQSAARTLLGVKGLCALFGVSKDWVYRRTQAAAPDPLPCVRFGKLIRFDEKEVGEFIESHRRASGGRLGATGGVARVIQRRYRVLTRKRFQNGYVRLRGKHDPYWEGFFREDILLADGQIVRKRRSKNLGRLAELPTKKLALRKLSSVVAELNALDYRPRSVMTVRDFVEDKYKKLVLPVRKPTTQHGYGVVLNRHVLPEIGDRQLVEVTSEDVQTLINRKVADGLSYNSVKNIRMVLSAVFTAAVKYGYRKENPARQTEMPPEPVRVLPPLPSEEELQHLIDALPEPYCTMVLLVCVSGVRIGELLALRWRAVDWKRRCLWVVEAVSRGSFHSPKTHRSLRPILLAEEDLKRLAEFRRRTPNASEDDWLFPNGRGTGPIRADKALARLQAAAKKANIPHVTWHLLRHWHTTVLHEEGVPLKAAQERLGHADVKTTMKHYVHISEEVAREAAEVASRRLHRLEPSRLSPESGSNFGSESVVAAAKSLETEDRRGTQVA
ncbi:MAG: tyrosine-type recombinase/integrase [Acidobacteria bacterium]|nr:tyrosine-type recombinase/integrase [Acidobacteriota bacterium]